MTSFSSTKYSEIESNWCGHLIFRSFRIFIKIIFYSQSKCFRVFTFKKEEKCTEIYIISSQFVLQCNFGLKFERHTRSDAYFSVQSFSKFFNCGNRTLKMLICLTFQRTTTCTILGKRCKTLFWVDILFKILPE